MSEASNSPGKTVASCESRTALVEFKKPEGISKKKKPKILTEEKYIEELSKIIQRDFFPDLGKLRAQNEYLDAMERKDYAQMEVIRAKYTGSRPTTQRPDLSPASFETPTNSVKGTPLLPHSKQNASDTPKSTISTNSITSNQSGDPKSIADKHSLDSFLNNYTSEDNYSFQEIVDAAEEKLRQKFSLLYNHESLSTDNLARALTLPSIEKQFNESDPAKMIETWTYKNKNSIMYIPDGVELTEAERIENASRKQIIQHSATRLHSNPFDEKRSQEAVTEIAKQQSQALVEKIGVDGNKVIPNNLSAPQIRGFDLVKTPSPRPGEAFSPLMTWGEIEGTPFRLDGSDTPLRPNAGPSFKMPQNSRRENIALALAEKVGVKIRAQKQRAMDTARKNIGSPYIRSNMDRLASMSPAARRLATTKLGLRTPSMTPSPLHTPALKTKQKSLSVSSKPIRPGDSLIRKTPSSTGAYTPRSQDAPATPKATLTDDLLQLPTAKTKRASAADFF